MDLFTEKIYLRADLS